MASKLETIKQFEGFGNDYKNSIGEYHRSSNFIKSKNGITSAGVLRHLIDTQTLCDIYSTPTSIVFGKGRGIDQVTLNDYIYSSDRNGSIIQSFGGIFLTGEYVHRAMNDNHIYLMGLISDPKSRILYMQDRYLGMADPFTTPNYIAGTVTLTSGSNAVVGSGTTFTAGMVGFVIRATADNKFYRISGYTDATHITLASNYAGTTGSGKGYIINTAWNDQWKDFGASVTLPSGVTSISCPMDVYEDTVIFGRGSIIVTLNILTDTITTDASPSLTVPAGYSIDHIVSNSNGILIAGSSAKGSFFFLWDNLSDRSISPWTWFDDTIVSVCKNGSEWIVRTNRGIYQTNGYAVVTLKEEFLDNSTTTSFINHPKNSIVIDKHLYFGATNTQNAKRRNVLYRMNIENGLMECFTRTNLNQGTMSILQFEYSNSAYRLFALISEDALAGIDYLSTEISAKCASYITTPIGSGENQKVAEKIKVRIRKNNRSASPLNAFTFNVAIKISTNKRTIYSVSRVKQTSASKKIIIVNNTASQFPTPKVGDEIEFVGDLNSILNAGYSRNVVSVTGAGTATETITVDSDFPELPQSGQYIVITPFRLVVRKTITVTDGEIQEIVATIKNSFQGTKFMIKVDIEDNTSSVPLEIQPIDIIYNDKGVL